MSNPISLPLTLLPDELSLPELSPGLGLVSAPGGALAQEAGRSMRAGESRDGGIFASREKLLRCLLAGDTGHWRGLLAVALLCDSWTGIPALRVVDYDRHGSPFVQSALEATGRSSLHLAVLGQDASAAILGMLDGETLLIPPARTQNLKSVLPRRVTWFDPESGQFSDPCRLLNQRDRHLLLSRLDKLRSASVYVRAFADDVAKIDEEIISSALTGEGQEAWQQRMKIILGLLPEDAFEELGVEEAPYVGTLPPNPLLRRFGVSDDAMQSEPPQVTYLWQGRAFARTNSAIGLEAAGDGAPELLVTAASRLEQHSRLYARVLSERLTHYLTRCDGQFLTSAKEALTQWRDDAQSLARQPLEAMTLVWPWDEADPSVRMLLRERLGKELADAAVNPFTERLTLLSGGDLGDDALTLGCTVYTQDGEAVCLPPLGEKLAAWLSAQPSDISVLPEGSLTVTPTDNGIQIGLTLQGTSGAVQFARTYEPAQCLTLEADKVPEVALWPAVPLENNRWRAYYLSVRGHIEALVWQDGWVSCAADGENGLGPCSILPLPFLPRAIVLRQGDETLGTALCLAPVCHPGSAGAAVAALDVGASGISMALTLDGKLSEVQIPTLLRMAVSGECLDLAGEMLPVWPLGPVIPSAVTLTEEGASAPFVDGCLCPAEALETLLGQDNPPDTDLIWRVDERAARARYLLWRQAMLMTSFHAVMLGAQSISWRLSLPGALSLEARRRLLEEAREAAVWVANETGLPQTTGALAEGMRSTLCAGMYLRDSGTVRGSLIMLDVGSNSAGMSLWLRGMNKPAAEWHLPLGLCSMLMNALEERPALLSQDFAPLPGMEALLAKNASDTRFLPAFSRRRLQLDQLFGPRLSDAALHMNTSIMTGSETVAHALLLLGYAELMLLCGLTLEKLSRNAMLNDYLPSQMTLCLCGRGALPFFQLDDGSRQGMMRFLRLLMQPNHPVRYVQVQASPYPRREATLGLCQLPDPSAQELPLPAAMPQAFPVLHMAAWFLQQFRACFPISCELLFPGMLSDRGMFSPEAQERILRAGDIAVGSDEEQLKGIIESVRAAYAALAIAREEAARAAETEPAMSPSDQEAPPDSLSSPEEAPKP